MVVLRSGKQLTIDSSIASKRRPKQVSCSKEPNKLKTVYVKKRADDPAMPYVTEALKSYNQNIAPQKYKLVEPGCLTPVYLGNHFLFHVDFVAKNVDAPNAPKEMFFSELILPCPSVRSEPVREEVLSVRLCVSLGPINSISGDIVNGCYYCRRYNSVHHPKDGGFVRGGDSRYTELEDICGIKLHNAENHLPMLEQVSQAHESKEREYTSEQVDDAMPYITEAMTFLNQNTSRSYELVEPGFVTRVILPTCFLFHVYFTAKKTDVADSPKMFFAELTSTGEVLSCKCCALLHPTDSSLGDKTGDKTNGCYYCRKYNNVRHPIGGGFVRGGDSLYKKIF